MHIFKQKNSGFTLIEVMVSIAIFSVVMVIVIGALLTLNDANKKAQALRAVVDNLNFAIEDMSRNIKTGKEYKCVTPNISGSSVSSINEDNCNTNQGTKGLLIKSSPIPFFNASGVSITLRNCYLYYFDNLTDPSKGTIKYAVAERVQDTTSCASVSSYGRLSNIISPEVKIDNAGFFVFNSTPGATQQPTVILTINGQIDVDKYKFITPFNIQTTISQRSSLE